jgi:hypothetical protein
VTESRSPVERVIAALRDDEAPPKVARERIRARLGVEPTIGGAAPVRIARPPALAPSPAWITPRSSTLALATFVAGTLVGAGLYARLGPSRVRVEVVALPPQATVPTVSLPAAPRPTAAPVPPSSESPAAPQASSPSEAPSPKPRPSSAVPANSADSQLTAERRLLDRARAALVAEEAPQALEWLARHRRLFPNGILSDERDALSVEALVKAGRYDEARQVAQVLLRRVPDSLFASTVRSAIESIPVTEKTDRANPH